MAIRAYGRSVGIRLSQPGLLARVLELLPPGSRPAGRPTVDHLYSIIVGGEGRGGTRRFHIAYSGASMIARTSDLGEALRRLEADMQLLVAEESRDRVFVHAGVVGWNGRAILVPGRSGSGKSTLVARLVQAGASYYSDEYALLDRRGWVHPYPVPVALGSRRAGKPQSRIPLETLAGRIGDRAIPVGRVVVTSYRPGAGWRPRRLRPGQGVLELLRHAVRARRAPRQVLEVLSRVVCGAEVLKGARGEAGEVATLLLGRGAAVRSPAAVLAGG